jgi:long-chain acyl-CoA synthetase
MDRWLYFLVAGLLRAFPLPARAGFRESFAFMGELVDRGTNVLVFPEGMRTRDGRMNPFRAGIGMLVNNLNIPVVPMRIDGLFPLKVARRAWAPAGAVKVTIGKPVRFEAGTDAEEIRTRLEENVAGLNLEGARR